MSKEKEPKTVEQLTKDVNFANWVILFQVVIIMALLGFTMSLRTELAGYKWSAVNESRISCQEKGGSIFNDRCVDKKIFLEDEK